MANAALIVSAFAALIASVGGIVTALLPALRKAKSFSGEQTGVLIDLLAEKDQELEACLRREAQREQKGDSP